MDLIQTAAAVAASVLSATHAFAGIVAEYDVGAGTATSTIQVDFSNGNGYLVTLRWDPGSTVTGFDALVRVRDLVPGSTLQHEQYPFGAFVTGIGLGADYEYGTGDLWPIENYWHYWTEVGGTWQMASFGASDRLLSDGSADAWVFGSGTAPQAVPAPGALALLLAVTCRAGGRARGR